MSHRPDGFTTLTPNLTIDGASDAIAHYQEALGARLDFRLDDPGTGLVLHAVMDIGESKFFIQDVQPGFPGPDVVGAPVSFYLYVPDADEAFDTACAAGMTEVLKPEDMFWGDRMARAKDPYGYTWTFATKVADVEPDAIAEAVKANP
ncbi:MAG: VOC family protein [Rhodospirillaceae bacterium]